MTMIPISTASTLAALLRWRRGEFPLDAFEALQRAIDEAWGPYGSGRSLSLRDVRGVLRTAAALWRFESKRTGDRDLWRAAKAAFDIAECKQVITGGEDL